MTFNIEHAAIHAKKAARQIALLPSQEKQNLLLHIASKLLANVEPILQANARDVQAAGENGLDAAMIDRLTLTPERLQGVAYAVKAVAHQDDPVGSMSEPQAMPSGIEVRKMRIPLGVIGMIYESRPNVTIDAAALCLKAGNAVILRGGKEALHSNLALGKCLHEALNDKGLDSAVVTIIPDPNREIFNKMLTLTEQIDLIIPRGGEGLIRFVSENSRIPVIQHFKGVCHLYVERQADQSMAIALLENGKTQRTGVCNALETLLVDASIASEFLPKVAQLFAQHKVKVHACDKSLSFFKHGLPATDDDWHAEYLALEIAVRVVDNFDHAIQHIDEFGSGHTEVICTQSADLQTRFINTVDAAVVMANASSRFSDGGELGLGAEIGISTTKLHAYGPMGARSLTTEKFVVTGQGHTRS